MHSKDIFGTNIFNGKDNDGFSTATSTDTVISLKAKKRITDETRSNINTEEYYKNVVVNKLLDDIKSHIIVESDNNYNNFSTDKYITASINVTKPGHKFVYKINEIFKVNKEMFTEEELIEAVKIAYPERFI